MSVGKSPAMRTAQAPARKATNVTLPKQLVAEARELGARRATLEVRASNEAARRLYERLGFFVAATRRNYYTKPVEDALVLWRDEPA